MFRTVTADEAGLNPAHINKFIDLLERNGNNMHSMLMMRGDDVFCEVYWEPYTRDSLQRMYSETKSFVSVAIGLLVADGLISLDDPICKYFSDKIDGELHPYMAKQTIRDNLMMRTCADTPKWFGNPDHDRVHLYFNGSKIIRPAGTIWKYDSAGSQVLAALVERVSGMSLFEFLKKRLFDKMGYFENAMMLSTPTGECWGDSSMICTLRDVAAFGRLVMNYGKWEGKQVVNEDYLRTAVSNLTDNAESGFHGYRSCGYGYQIWRTEHNGFAFFGMGNQLTICLPDYNFLFSCTADDQGNASSRQVLMNGLFDLIVDNLDKNETKKSEEAIPPLKLRSAQGMKSVPILEELNGQCYTCEENPTGIKEFSLTFNDDTVKFSYQNETGMHDITCGLCRNEFTFFPETGQPDLVGDVPSPGHQYRCAASAAWRCDNKLELQIRIIDKYLGNITFYFGFIDDYCSVNIVRNTEAFLEKYEGTFTAKK